MANEREIGEHGARLLTLEKDMTELKGDVKQILAEMHKAKGGYKTLMLVANVAQPFGSVWRSYPTIGYHFFAWGEKSAATGSTTWNSLSGAKMSGVFWG